MMTVTHPQADMQTVAHFAHLPTPALIATANALGLHMTEATLSACAALYGKLGRDPYVEELKLLDVLCLSYGRLSLKQAPLDSLQTEDERIAATLHDVLEHCPRQGGKTLPLTPERVLNLRVATPPTSPSVARTAARPVLMSDEDFATLGASALGANECICIEGTSLRLSLCHPARRAWPTAPKRGDLITLLAARPESDAQVYHRMQDLLQQFSGRLHAVSSVARGELFPTLLEHCDKGLRADVSLLNQVLAHIGSSADEISGALVFSSVAGAKALCDRAQALGLVCVSFAQRQNDGLLSAAYHAETKYSLPITLLHTLRRELRLSVGVREKQHADDTLLCDRPSLGIQKDRSSTVRQVPGKPLTLGEYKVIHTTLALSGELCPHHVELALMRAAQHLVAAGGDFATMQVGVGVCLNGRSSLAPLWSGILGIERLLCLWQLPALAPVIRTGEGEGSITLCLVACTVHPSAPHSPEGSPLLHLFSVTEKEHFPDPRQMRDMLALTSKRLSQGCILGLCPLWGESPAQALLSLGQEIPDKGHTEQAEWHKPCYGLLIRANTPLSPGIYLGSDAKTGEKEPQNDLEPIPVLG